MTYIDDLNDFNTKIKRIEKLIFLTKLFKSKKIMLTTLEEQHEAGKSLLVLILKFNHAKGHVKLTSKPQENILILRETVSKNWEIESHVESVLNLMELHTKHKKSPIEFMKKGTVIILDDDQNIEKINLEKLKAFLDAIKTIKDQFQEKINESI